MKHFLTQILHFSRAERAGTIALMIVCGLIYLAPAVFHWWHPQHATDFSQFQADVRTFREKMSIEDVAPTGKSTGELFAFDPNTATAEEFVQLGLSEKVAGIICNYRNKGGHFRQPDDLQKIYSLPAADFQRLRPWIQIGGAKQKRDEEEQPAVVSTAELFAFDPNLASEGDFRRLGLSSRTIKSILNYRVKGGQFRKTEDFAKIYTLDEEDYTRLAPYLTIGALATTGTERPATYAGGAHFPDKKIAFQGPLDINRAALEDWLQLPGIGEKRAQQIINRRELLGGFISVAQVAETFNLPDSVFQRIQPRLILESRDVRQLNINAVSAEDLDRHPYISLKQATLIINYRSQHGPFASVEDLSKIVVFATDKKWLEKIKPYLATQ